MREPAYIKSSDALAYGSWVLGSGLAGSGVSRSNNGSVAFCTLGLGLLNPPPKMVGKLSTSLFGWGEGGVCSLVSGGR